jgi:hypothetical protein
MTVYKEKAYLSDLLLAEVLPAWSRQPGVIAAGADLPMGSPMAKVGSKFLLVDFAATDEAGVVVSILAEDAPAATEDVTVALIRRGAVIDPEYIVWPAGVTNEHVTAALHQLEAVGIVYRESL